MPGEASKDGQQGPAGPQGETGPQGVQGETGPSAASTTRLAEFAFNREDGDFQFTVSCAKDERAVGNGYRAMSGLVQVRDSYMYDNEFTFGGQVDRPVNLLLQVQCQQLDVQK